MRKQTNKQTDKWTHLHHPFDIIGDIKLSHDSGQCDTGDVIGQQPNALPRCNCGC